MTTAYTISESQLENLVKDTDCEEGSTCKNLKNTHLANQKRIVKVNSYYGKKFSAQTKILKTIYIMVICVIVISVMRIYLDFIPDLIFTIAMSLVIGIFIINILFQSVDITNRNNIDYDLYDTNLSNLPPLASDENTESTGTGAGGINMATSSKQMLYGGGRGKGCYNQQCCPTFFSFNPTLGYCSLNPFV
jgi:hypothetical protein